MESESQRVGVESTENPLKRSEKLDGFVGEKSFALEQAQDFVSPESLRGMEIDVGYGTPLPVVVPNPSRRETVNAGMGVDDTSEGLRHGDDAGAGIVVADGF